MRPLMVTTGRKLKIYTYICMISLYIYMHDMIYIYIYFFFEMSLGPSPRGPLEFANAAVMFIYLSLKLWKGSAS